MNIIFNKPVMVFRKDFENRAVYRLGLSKRLKDGTYDNAYIECQFKKDVSVENMTKILPTDAWLTFYKTKDGKTVSYIFINQFEEEMIEMDLDEVLPPVEEQTSIDIDDLDQLLD